MRLIWSATPRLTVAWVLLLIMQGLIPAAIVYLTRQLVDSLVAVANSGGNWMILKPTLVLAGFMAGFLLLAEVMRAAGSWVRTAQAEYIQDHLSGLVHRKSINVDLSFYESPDYHDRLEQARTDLKTRPLTLLENIGKLFQNSLTLIAIAALLIPYGIWIPIALMFSALPASYLLLRHSRRLHQWWEQTTADRRRTNYYELLITHSGVAAELRLFNFGSHFMKAFQSLRARLRTEKLNLTREQDLYRLVSGLIGMLISGTLMVWFIWRAAQGFGTLGDIALFYQALNRGQRLLSATLESLMQIYGNALFLGNLFEFFNLEPKVVDPLKPDPAPGKLRSKISIRQITFRYPGSDRAVFQNFSLNIPAGRIAAIVGPNGSGKSTFLKLLCRFYDVEAGCIELDETNIRKISIRELRRMFTVLFQWPVPYQMTAAQNIALGDLSLDPGLAEIEAAARSAGVHEIIRCLPQGYETQLGKWFDNGIELSVGEWQRLALARAYYRQTPIILLDEPTSALDPWSEADWFERFRNLADGRTAILITHRLTTAMHADRIYVMVNGQIVEHGRHNELISHNGFYARSWNAQMVSPNENKVKIVSDKIVGLGF